MADDIRERAQKLLEAKQRLQKAVKPTLGERAAKLISPAKRGLRGLALGAVEAGIGGGGPGVPGIGLTPQQEQFLRGFKPEERDPLEVTARGVSPEFQPKNKEEMWVAGLTELGFDIGVTAAMSARAGAKLLPQILRGGLSGATASALDQSTRTGDIKLEDISIGALIGTVFPLIGPTTAGIGNIFRGITRLIASGSRTLRPETVRLIERMANLLEEATGNPKVISNMIMNAQKGVHKVLARSGEILNKIRAKIGLDNFVDDGIAVLRPGYSPAKGDDLLDLFDTLRKSTGQESKRKLRQLLQLRKKAKELVSFRQLKTKQGFEIKPLSKSSSRVFDDKGKFKAFINQVDDEVRKTPGGIDQLRVNKLYSNVKTRVETILNKIGDPDQAPKFLQTLLKGNLDEIIELDQSTLNSLRWAERQLKTPILAPLQKEFTVKALKESILTGPIGLLGAAPGEAGVVEVLKRGAQVQRGLGTAGQILKTQAAKGITTPLIQRGLEE